MNRRCQPLFAALVLLVATTLLASASASADTPGSLTTDESTSSLGAEIAGGQLDEDFFIHLNLLFTARFEVAKAFCDGFFPDPGESDEAKECVTNVLLGMRVPLRLRAIDRDPTDEKVLREEDWDEVSDYFKVLRFVEYGKRKEPIYLRVGELSGVVIGHGTIMNGYYNTIDIDHYQMGFNSNLNSRYGGVELMLDNFVDPEILGYRGYIHPWRFIAPSSFWTRYSIGTSLVLDIDAPVAFEIEDPVEGTLRVDGQNNLVVAKSQTTGVVGLDHELLLVQTELVDFIPYLDTNYHFEGSLGYHLGALINLRPLEELSLYSRAELRLLGNNYLPDYFGSLYEIERNSFLGFGGLGEPKLVVTRDRDEGQIAGAYGELTADLVGFLLLTGSYEDYQGPRNGSLMLRAKIPELGPLSLGALYRRAGFNGLNDAFELDNALAIGEARYRLTPFFYLLGQYSRLWRLQSEGPEQGQYETVDDWFVGAGFAVAL